MAASERRQCDGGERERARDEGVAPVDPGVEPLSYHALRFGTDRPGMMREAPVLWGA